MPLGAAGISAAGSLAGGVLGSKGAKNAADQYKAGVSPALTVQQQNAQNTASDVWTSQGWANNALNDAKREGQQMVGDATTQGQQANSLATLQGMAGIAGATQTGQAGVNTGVAGANQTLTDSQKAQLAQLSPYATSGSTALSSLQQLSGPGGPLTNQFSFNPSDLQNDPGYQFTLQQGQDALQRSAAAKGQLFSGGTLKSLAGYTTGTANQYFGDAFNRAQSTFNTNQQQALSRIGTLQGLAGLGYNAATAGAGAIGSTSAAQANNTLGGSQFNANLRYQGGLAGANLGEQGTQFGASLGETGSQYDSNLGLTVGQGLAGNTLWGEQSRATSGQNFANNASNLYTNTGNANANAVAGSTNSWLSTLNNGTNATLQYLAGRPANNGSTTSGVPGYNPANASSNLDSYDEFS